MLRSFLIVFLLCCGIVLTADVQYQLTVEPDQPRLRCGQLTTFQAQATADGPPQRPGSIALTVTNDDLDRLETGNYELAVEPATLSARLTQPGFLRCDAVLTVDGKEVARAAAAAAVEPEKIKQGYPMPPDFNQFWQESLAELQQIPVDARIEPLPEFSDGEFNAYQVSFANVDGKRIYGFLNIPKAEGTFPAVVSVPGAGPANFSPTFRYPGIITLFMNVHEYEALPDRDANQQRHDATYEHRNYPAIGQTDRKKFFFRDAYLGINRAIDYVRHLPQYDGENLGIFGSSQGGASALILSGMNPDTKYTVANVPALCDHGGYLAGRASGWPRVAQGAPEEEKQAVLQAVSYVDAANFARRIQNPVVVLVGWIDPVCPPSSVYAAYNNIPSRHKQMIDVPDMAHEWRAAADEAIREMLDFLRDNHQKMTE